MNIKRILSDSLFRNSSWGFMSHIFQTVFVSLFFVIVARSYSTEDFGMFVIAMALYQLLSAFSSLGLSQWFIREFSFKADKSDFVSSFFKMQFTFGILFYFISILVTISLYSDRLIILLSLILGTNIVFDNVINAIKSLNIAEFKQKKTFIIISIESFLKFVVACFLFIYPFSIVVLCICLMIIRVISLGMFIKVGSSKLVNLHALWKYKVSTDDIRKLIYKNWPFIVIGGISFANFRVANILISKMLSVADVANYEIAYKIFSIGQMIPVIISASVYPILVKQFNENNIDQMASYYRKMYAFYLLFGLVSFTFVYSFADVIVPFAFGEKYVMASVYAVQMFLTMLVFPTAYLQANVIVAMKMERSDMWFNVVLLFSNLFISVIGLYFIRSLSVINISFLVSFLIFHVLQNVLLTRKNITTIGNSLSFYFVSGGLVYLYIIIAGVADKRILYFIFWTIAGLIIYMANRFRLSRKVLSPGKV